jgi:hypothetical protein
MLLRIFDTHLGAQDMEDICELGHCLVSFLPQCGQFCVQVVITSNNIVLLLNNIHQGLPSFLKQHFEGISCPIVFLFSQHERSLGRARDFFLKRNKLETQFFVP